MKVGSRWKSEREEEGRGSGWCEVMKLGGGGGRTEGEEAFEGEFELHFREERR